jgi:hypothetical protein
MTGACHAFAPTPLPTVVLMAPRAWLIPIRAAPRSQQPIRPHRPSSLCGPACQCNRDTTRGSACAKARPVQPRSSSSRRTRERRTVASSSSHVTGNVSRPTPAGAAAAGPASAVNPIHGPGQGCQRRPATRRQCPTLCSRGAGAPARVHGSEGATSKTNGVETASSTPGGVRDTRTQRRADIAKLMIWSPGKPHCPRLSPAPCFRRQAPVGHAGARVNPV